MFRNLTLGVVLLVTAIATWTAVGAAEPKKQPAPSLPIIPLFKADQDRPLFVLDYTNETNGNEDAIKLFMEATITLDGNEHNRHTVIMIHGRAPPPVKAGAQLAYLVDLVNYLPPDQSKHLKLDPGLHTLWVKFGGKEYGPIRFFWDTHDRKAFGPLPAD